MYVDNTFSTLINLGCKKNVGNVVFKAPRDGATLWEIGIPDRSAAEFFIPGQEPKYKIHKYNARGFEKYNFNFYIHMYKYTCDVSCSCSLTL